MVPVWQDNLVWILVDVGSGECAVVDGPEAGPVLAYCEARGLEPTTILNTHHHPDHVGINRELEKGGHIGEFRVVASRVLADRTPGANELVGEGDRVRLGGLEGEVWLTEGHVDGHVTYRFDDVVFCGDTMFGAGCGYLFDGPPEKMHRSLQRLAALPGTTRVCCAHEYTEDNLRFAWSVEPDNEALAERIRRVWALRAEGRCSVPFTIEEERATNPFVRCASAEAFAARRALKDTRAYKARGDEGLPITGR